MCQRLATQGAGSALHEEERLVDRTVPRRSPGPQAAGTTVDPDQEGSGGTFDEQVRLASRGQSTEDPPLDRLRQFRCHPSKVRSIIGTRPRAMNWGDVAAPDHVAATEWEAVGRGAQARRGSPAVEPR